MITQVCVCTHAQSCLTLCHPMDWRHPGLTVHGISEYWRRLPCPSPGDLNPRLNLCLLHWQAGSLPCKPLRKSYDRGSMCISPPYNHYYYFYTNIFFSWKIDIASEILHVFFQLGFTNTIVQKSTQYCVNEKNEASDDGEHSEQKVRNDIHMLV